MLLFLLLYFTFWCSFSQAKIFTTIFVKIRQALHDVQQSSPQWGPERSFGISPGSSVNAKRNFAHPTHPKRKIHLSVLATVCISLFSLVHILFCESLHIHDRALGCLCEYSYVRFRFLFLPFSEKIDEKKNYIKILIFCLIFDKNEFYIKHFLVVIVVMVKCWVGRRRR